MNDTLSEQTLWWRGAAIYQIYPRSFADSNGDGIGDLPGITARLPHIASLGVEAIWISPFFTSPMADYGYDVADYRDVDPIFGTLTDFDALIARAHELGIKVTIDLVFAHTSDAHPWFAASRTSKKGDHADWYVWCDANPDGTPPNNWQSVFGGPAWTWDARRQQYYYHQFLKEQPQLNAHNPMVQEACLDVMRFWLDRGVDGFRLDALNHAFFDPDLRDNPVSRGHHVRTRPFDFQDKIHSQNHPAAIPFIERIGALCGEYGAIFTVAEVGGDGAVGLMKDYTAGDARLSSAYSFDFLYAPELTPQRIKTSLGQWHGGDEGWPSWAFENHDAPRHISRWANGADLTAYARLTMALLIALRGNIFLYQGQELALTQDEIPFHLLKDPEAIANWPLTLSRDGVRTPMPWQSDAPHGGFTDGEPWLPLSEANIARAAATQEADPASPLHWTRAMLALRRGSTALRIGAMEDVHTHGMLLHFARHWGDERVHCAFNLGAAPMRHACPAGALMLSVNGGGAAQLPPFGAVFIRQTLG
ncbi:alpha-glucosidase [Novosphingobium sediminicola]|uniref:Alpha-glucosidase n=1 Tax=Novosphingobium sediminicola TaxID=563162 RepID=A0A7W6G5R3_9SPHN|nr:alpha-glucosidase [Novosphingobium sediminicola]MBB3954984.1 alpha-glucosidase [Novosphingobium sediminicola]